MALRVFISWSGTRSKLVAVTLATWLPEVIPGIETWFSEKTKGGTVAWFEKELNKELRRADFAVICVLPENWNNPWLSYESGVVLGKIKKETRIFPYVIDKHAKRRAMPDPLHFFWAEMANFNGTLKLVEAISEAARGRPLTKTQLTKLRRVFEEKWPDLNKVLKKASPPRPPTPPPSPEDYFRDFMKVSRDIREHQHQLYGCLHEVINKTVASVKERVYDYEETVRLAASEIRRSKDRFSSHDSLLVGNVADFFAEHYTEEDLRRLVAEMGLPLKPYLKRKRPPTAKELNVIRDGWIAQMKLAVLEVFSRFYSILLDLLNAAIKRGR